MVMKISPAAYQELRTIYLNMTNHSARTHNEDPAFDRAMERFASFLIKADQVNSL
jgi:hypothetical protein